MAAISVIRLLTKESQLLLNVTFFLAIVSLSSELKGLIAAEQLLSVIYSNVDDEMV